MGEGRIVKIALGQMKVFQGDTEKNLKKILDLTDQAAAQNADIICFPELAYCGYFLESEELQRLAQPQDGPFVQTLRKKAKSAGIHIIAGYAEAGEIPGIMYNSCIFIDDQGEIIGNMRKVNAWGQEKLKFREGREFPVIQTKFGKVGMLICYDVEFPEPSRIEALKGAEIVFCSAVWSIPAAGVSWFGLKAMGVGNKLMSVGMIIMLVVLTIASFLSKDGDFSRVTESNWSYAIPIFNVAAFSYIGQYLVPDLARGLSHDPKKLAPAVSIGQLLVCILLIIVPLGVMYLTPADELTEVATIAWGRSLGLWAMYTANIFALVAMLTSYWAISQTLLSNIVDKFRFHSDEDIKIRLPITLVIVGIPLFLALGGFVGFVDAIYFSGTFAGAIMAILPIFMLRGARKKGEIEPDWNCGWMANPVIQGIIIILYSGTILYAVCGAMGLLPAGW